MKYNKEITMQSKYTKIGHQAPVKTLQQILREIQPTRFSGHLRLLRMAG